MSEDGPHRPPSSFVGEKMECVKCGRTKTAQWYRYESSKICQSCYGKARAVTNRLKFKEYNATPTAKERRKLYEKTQAGKAVRKKVSAKYCANNKEKIREQKAKYEARTQCHKKHYINNKAYYQEKCARRNRKLDRASLGNAFKNQTVAIYDACPPGHSIDHIIPINGKTVSGLHVPWNLQYLTTTENLIKSNKLLLTNEENTKWVIYKLNNPSVELEEERKCEILQQ